MKRIALVLAWVGWFRVAGDPAIYSTPGQDGRPRYALLEQYGRKPHFHFIPIPADSDWLRRRLEKGSR